MKKTLLFFILILCSSIGFAQVEPSIRNITYTNNANFVFGTTLDSDACYGISSNEVWCVGRLPSRSYQIIYLYNNDTNTLTNPYNITMADHQLGSPCVYYPTDGTMYCFRGTGANETFKVNISTGEQTSLASYSATSEFNECDLRPNSDEIFCTGEEGGSSMFIRVYNITSNSWSYPIDLYPIYGQVIYWQSCDFTDSNTWICYGGQFGIDKLLIYHADTNTTNLTLTGNNWEAGSCHTFNNIFYCTFGDDGTFTLPQIYYYDISTNTFGTLNTTLPIGFSIYGDAGVIGNSMFALGGYAGDNWDNSNDLLEVSFPFVCTPDWSCNGYSACMQNNSQNCNSVLDLNSCGETYTGDYSEFAPQSCTYNQITGYVPAHKSSDVPAMIIDFGVEFGMVMIAFAGVIIIIGLGTVAIKLFKK